MRVGGLGVSFSHARIHRRILPILVVIVLVDLPDVIGWIADDDEHRRCLLLLHALRIIRREQLRLSALRQIERIHEADAFKRPVSLGGDVKFVFNVERCDVIGQE